MQKPSDSTSEAGVQSTFRQRTFIRRFVLAVFVLTLAAAACAGTAYAQNWSTEQMPDDFSGNLNDVVQTSDGAYAVGANGFVLNRTDQGWQEVITGGPMSNNNNLFGAGVTDDGDVLWFVGASGAIGRYDVTTGNLSDRSQPQDSSNNFNDVAVTGNADDADVYVAGDSGKIHYSLQNGEDQTWSSVEPQSGSAIPAIDFYGNRTGHAVDKNQFVLNTTDGETWGDIGISDTTETFVGLDSHAADDVWVSSDNGVVFRYDGSWTNNNLTSTTSFNDIEIDGGSGYVAGGGGEMWRYDGTGWSEENVDTGNNLNAVTIAGPEIAVGDSATAVVRNVPANYQLSNLNPQDETVSEDSNPIDVSVDVENTGGDTGGQDIRLEVSNTSGTQYTDTISGFEVDALSEETATFTDVPVDQLAVGDYTHTVSSDNDTVSGSITVQELQPNLDVHGFSAEFPDGTGSHDYGEVAITVEETEGVETENLEVTLEVEGDDSGAVFSETDSSESLQGGQTEFVFDVGVLDEDGYQATATADADNADSDSTTVDFEVSEQDSSDTGDTGDTDDSLDTGGIGGGDVNLPPAEFEAEVEVTPEEPEQGGEVEVEIEVENVGGQEGSADVELVGGDEVVSDTTVSLIPRSTETVELSTNPAASEFDVMVEDTTVESFSVEQTDDGDDSDDEDNEAEILSADTETGDTETGDTEAGDSNGDDGESEGGLPLAPAGAVLALAVLAVLAALARRQMDTEE